jgi:hypothetical protein
MESLKQRKLETEERKLKMEEIKVEIDPARSLVDTDRLKKLAVEMKTLRES